MEFVEKKIASSVRHKAADHSRNDDGRESPGKTVIARRSALRDDEAIFVTAPTR